MNNSNNEKRFKKTLAYFKNELSNIRDNRPNPKIIEDLKVEVYGSEMPIKQLGTVSVSSSNLITVSVWDKRNTEEVKKAIDNADLNLHSVVDGQIVKVPLPSMTEERRKEMVELIKDLSEKAKITIRNVRRELIEELNEVEGISEDDIKRGEKEIQRLVDKYNEKVEESFEKKKNDLLTL